MKHRKFTSEEQLAFAELSGDYNPLHIDAVAARRLLFGSPVVHGIHSLLWGLDSWLVDRTESIELRSIKAAFSKPIRVGAEVGLLLKSVDEEHIRIELLSDESVVTRIEIEWGKSEQRNFGYLETCFPQKLQPCALLEDKVEAQSGTLDLCLNTEAAATIFPHLVRCVSPMQIAILLGTTRLVGMECPGLHSVYSELSLLAGDAHECTGLKYEVTKYDKRFAMVFIKVTAPGMAGVIKAFVRPVPQEQDDYLNIKEVVSSHEFSGQRALVIGGSRGLGEVTAKLLAAGASELKITYHQGEEDADRVVEEITSNGGTADCFQFDVLSPEQNIRQVSLNDWAPTHLYYFATPFISSGVKGRFSANLFNKFCDYYVAGFLNTMNALRSLELRNVFYPSSIFVDELPLDMGEYAAAKMAGEMLCLFLEKNNKDLIIYRPRLSKMSTDQTVSLFPVDNQNPVPIMLNHLRSFRDISGSRRRDSNA